MQRALILAALLLAISSPATAVIKPIPTEVIACPWVVTNSFIAALKRIFYPNPSIMN